jgi:hypothetical protein
MVFRTNPGVITKTWLGSTWNRLGEQSTLKALNTILASLHNSMRLILILCQPNRRSLSYSLVGIIFTITTSREQNEFVSSQTNT